MVNNDRHYTCYLVSNKPHLYDEIQKSLYPEKLHYFDGSNKGCFSKLINICVEQCPTETIIIISDKMRPKSSDITKIIDLLNSGYGFVALYRFGFFGFKKELFRRIGPMDERFIGGGYEDNDFYIRLKEADIACYITEEAEYLKGPSSWDYSISKEHFVKKWIPDFTPVRPKLKNYRYERLLEEEKYDYDWGKSQETVFLNWDKSLANAVGKIVKWFERPDHSEK